MVEENTAVIGQLGLGRWQLLLFQRYGRRMEVDSPMGEGQRFSQTASRK